MDRASLAGLPPKSGATSSRSCRQIFSAVGTLSRESGIIFVQKAMVVTIVNDLTGAFLNLADIDQHSSSRIGLTAEYKVSHIIASGAVARGAFFTEKPAIFFRGKFLRKTIGAKRRIRRVC